jgi:hypothetical protein
MFRIFGLTMLVLVMLTGLAAAPCRADVGVAWSGDLTVEENILDSQWSFDNILHLKLELNNGESQRGVVLLKVKTPKSDSSAYDLGLLSVDQAYIDLMPSSSLLFRVGRQKIPWGSSFSWNPTNYIGSGKNRAEFMIDNPGVDVIDVEYTGTNTSFVVALKPKDD